MKSYADALKYAFLLLKYRARSKKEIAGRLAGKKYSRALIERVIEYLEKNRYLDDKAFASLFIESALNKGWGRRKIACALCKYGVPEDIYRQALTGDAGFKENLERLMEKKIRAYKGKKNTYQRLVRFLISRGYEYDEIKNALRASNIEYEDK